MGQDFESKLSADELMLFTMEMVDGLRAAATATMPDWERFGIIWSCEPGVLRHAQELWGPSGSTSSWSRADMLPLEIHCAEWWQRYSKAGVRVWQSMFLSVVKATGDVESFWVYPDQEGAEDWLVRPWNSDELMARAWARVAEGH